MKRRVYWLVVFSVYGYVAFRLLWRYVGPTADGSGYMATLVLPGFQPPDASEKDFVGDWHVRLQFQIPYLVYAAVFTLAGCMATVWLARRIPRVRTYKFAGTALVTFVLLLLLPLASDLGNFLRIWHSPRWFGWEVTGFWVTRMLPYVFLPLSMLSGLAVLGGEYVAPTPIRSPDRV